LATIFSPEEFSFQPDGLASTAAEKWVKQKVAIISEYLYSFCGHVAGKVDDVIFIDLCAGNGLYSMGARKELFPSSALAALALDLPISKYVFCEEDAERAGILKIRVNKYFRGKNIVILEGNYTSVIDRLRMYVPSTRGKYKVACLCLVDTFSLDVPFETIEALTEMGFSFLMPFTFALNSQLNFEFYLIENRDRLKRFLGMSTLERIETGIASNSQFYKHLVRAYEQKLLAMGFNVATSVHKIDSGLMEMPLYCMGLFSRQVPTKVIQGDVGAAQHTQFELFGK
jgi:three-Cys-motif partner protein